MNLPHIDNQNFTNQDYRTSMLSKAEYSYCAFTNCNFENSDISNIVFLECEFFDCNFSNVNVKHTTFNDTIFTTCKLVGVNFKDCNSFLMAFHFNRCNLSLSTFSELTINNTKFYDCKLHQVDFTFSEIKSCLFQQCDLQDVIFENTNLEKSDLSTAFNFSIDPSRNNLKNAIFSKENLSGLLKTFKIKVK
ncbi:pentapeptide repeat-containing protein [uncultured Winogradskyella sp.]|uniref:pentapeptide repeat-containing protein n=1 Tax=uncultured Winogradskyella sp. TaxID=395353 RepID=UPI00262FF0AE|nr:pentapeptide repeat-containing protein [uncultured Winogradskyella sp.]